MIRKELVAGLGRTADFIPLRKSESYGYAIIQEVKARSGAS